MSAVKTHARKVVRGAALNTFSAWRSLRGKDVEAFKRPRVHFPYLHDVPQQEEGAFRKFVETLAKDHTFISYSEAVHRVQNGVIDKPYVAFSFDDGFSSNVNVARILEEFGTTGCFFVPPGFIDSSLSTGDAMKAFGFAEGTHEAAMTWNDLEAMKSRGHEVENHTMNHKTLSLLTDTEVSDEISMGAERIREVLGDCRHFAWPRGQWQHFTSEAAAVVFDSGHESCASAVRGAHVEPILTDPRALCIRRDHEMTAWPLRQMLYFLSTSSQHASKSSNEWPEHWNGRA